MINILDSIQPVIKNSVDVKINQDAVLDFVKHLSEKDFEHENLLAMTKEWNWEQEQYLAFVIFLEALNFSYWGEPKWAIKYKEKEYDGFYGMIYCLKRAIDNDYPIFNAKYLKDLKENDFKEIFKGNTEIPLAQERFEIIKDLGEILEKDFLGLFSQVIESRQWEALSIVEILAEKFPNIFNDIANYQGNIVSFYKRAQLVPAHLKELFDLEIISKKVKSLEKLTAFADYKVPQSLRKYKITEYSIDLANKVDNMIEIPAGSTQEIEIRANTIWAIELIKEQLKKKNPDVNSVQVDELLWLKGQNKSPDDKPYHRVRTIWY